MTVLDDIQALAASLPVRRITAEGGALYMSRYKLHGWMPDNQGDFPCSVYLHNIHLADADDALHSHPWAWSQTTVLHGGYYQTFGHLSGADGIDRESRGEEWVCAGDARHHPPGFVHRIHEVLPDTWTLFVVGPKAASWGFYVEGRGMVPWRVRLKERGLEPAY